MPEIFYSILTNRGIEKYTAADAGGPIVGLTEFAAGDSNGAYYEPLPTQVTLVAEQWRGAVNRVYVHPNNASWMVVEALIPAAVGGFDIREAGLFDAAGELIAVAKYPLTTKPAAGSGSEKDLYLRLIFERANAGAVTQTIDPSLVLATKEYVDSRDWRESVRAATVANIADLAAGAPAALDGVALAVGNRVLVKNQAAAGGNGIYVVDAVGSGADGAWSRAADADNGLDISANFSVAVEEGTINADSLWMLTTDHPIDLGVTALAFKRLITQAELDAHTGDTGNPHQVDYFQVGAPAVGDFDFHVAATAPHSATSAATANRLALRDASGRLEAAAGISGNDLVNMGQFLASLASSGYQKIPGGVIFQWGYVTGINNGTTVTFPVAFPTVCYGVVTTQVYSTTTDFNQNVRPSASRTQFVYGTSSNNSSGFWVAVGK